MHSTASLICAVVTALVIMAAIIAFRPQTCADIQQAKDKAKAWLMSSEGYMGPNFGWQPQDYAMGAGRITPPGCNSAVRKDYACHMKCLEAPGNRTYASCMGDCLVPV